MKEPKPDPRMSGRVATYALLAIFAFVVLFVWIGA